MALRNYAYDYNSVKKEKVEQRPVIKLLKNKNFGKLNKNKASKASLILTTLSIFAMLVIINYRYNIISEKNLNVQRLEIAQTEANALLTSAEIEYNRMVDIVEVEAYAKQQLGMQEPEKNQMVYIGSEYQKQVVANKSDNIFSGAIESIKQMINDIF